MKKTILLSLLFGLVFNIQAQLSTISFDQQTNVSGDFNDLTAAATTLYSQGADDEETTGVPIGFDFYYDHQMYNTVTVGVNGAISFTETQIYAGNNLASTSAGYINMVAPFWEDLKIVSATGYVKYETIGTAPNRKFYVLWKNVTRYGSAVTGDCSFELYLEETTNTIKFIYGHNTMAGVDGDASIGLSKYTSTTSYVSVTPGAPATTSTSTANNTIHLADFPLRKNYTFFQRPNNDYYGDPIELSTLNSSCQTYYAYNLNATNSGGTTPTCANFQGGDVWFKFTAPAYGAVKIKRLTQGDWGGMGYAVYSESGGLNSTPLMCDDITVSHLNEYFFIYNLVPGDNYRLRLWDFGNDNFGIISFCIAAGNNDPNTEPFVVDVQPENALSYVETYANNNGATASPNPPTGVNGYNGGDVWFQFVAPSNGQLAVVHSDTAGYWSSFAFAIYESLTANYVADGIVYIAGHTAPYDPVVITGLTPGTTYYLRAWDYNNDNFGVSQFYLREDTTSGIEDYQALNLKYFPNPATDIINVSAEDNMQSISIMNLSGQVVIKETPRATHTQINIASLPQGVYVMKVNMEGDQSTIVKIIKK